MKTYLRIAIEAVLMLSLMWRCTPEEATFYDLSIVDLSRVDCVVIMPNHKMVLADGHATLDLRPMLYTDEGYLVPDDRVKEEWLEYSADGNTKISRNFTTDDLSLVGKTLTTRVKIKGTNVESVPVSFQVVAPLEREYTTEITVPVVFHIVQTVEDIESYRGKYDYDRLELLLQKLNNVFSAAVSVYPVGVDTHIRFRFAEYDPYGQPMVEPGVNRLAVEKITTDNRYADFLIDRHLDWPTEHYMNIWLISDRKKEVSNFGVTVTDYCQPHYVSASVTEESMPKGLELAAFSEGTPLTVAEAGIIYKLQELDEMDRTWGPQYPNDLIYYVGRYLGLLPTCDYRGETTDYCDDTIDYWKTEEDENRTWYKHAAGCYFRSENIMDDTKGMHCAVSRDQCMRMRWVLQHCPDRGAWKSDFAFKGK